jgi:hypothetical protein
MAAVRAATGRYSRAPMSPYWGHAKGQPRTRRWGGGVVASSPLGPPRRPPRQCSPRGWRRRSGGGSGCAGCRRQSVARRRAEDDDDCASRAGAAARDHPASGSRPGAPGRGCRKVDLAVAAGRRFRERAVDGQWSWGATGSGRVRVRARRLLRITPTPVQLELGVVDGQHLVPVSPLRLGGELVDSEPDDLLKRDPTRRQVGAWRQQPRVNRMGVACGST